VISAPNWIAKMAVSMGSVSSFSQSVAIHRAATSCSNPANNTTTELSAGLFIGQVNSPGSAAMTITSSDSLGVMCNYSGTLSQAGQMGSILGTYSCNNGDAGNFSMFELQVNISGITGRFAQNSNLTACVHGSCSRRYRRVGVGFWRLEGRIRVPIDAAA
jgi:hypothetical protein